MLASSKNERKKIALCQETVEKLKTYSRYNGLKTRLVIDSMIDIVLEDEALSQRVIELSHNKEAD
jgi:KaiC/GvpD/RAD55 family RecA-like ATPase